MPVLVLGLMLILALVGLFIYISAKKGGWLDRLIMDLENDGSAKSIKRQAEKAQAEKDQFVQNKLKNIQSESEEINELIKKN